MTSAGDSSGLVRKGLPTLGSIRAVRDAISRKKLQDFTMRDFKELCDAAFGPMLATVPVVCWLDEANNDPDQKSEIAVELFELLKPGGNLLRDMQEAPQSAEFRARLRPNKWKTVAPVSSDTPPLMMPLYFLGCRVAEKVDGGKDLASADASIVPPGLLVPFWSPPVQLEKSESASVLNEKIECSTLGYFLLRLFLYGSERTNSSSEGILQIEQKSTVELWLGGAVAKALGRIEHAVSKLMSPPSCATSFPFYFRLLQAHTSHFVQPATILPIVRSPSIENIGWNVSESTAAVLLLLPIQAWLRGVDHPAFERNRQAVLDIRPERNLMFVARLTMAAEHLRHSYQTLLRAAPLARDEPKMSLVREDHGFFGLSAAASMIRLHRYMERSALILVRQLSMSLPMIHWVRHGHIKTVVDLWTALTQPLDTNDLVLRHYEAITLIADVLRMLSEIDVDRLIDESVADSICAALSVMDAKSVGWLLQELRNDKINTDSLRSFYLLDWSDESGVGEVIPATDGQAAVFATKLYGKLQHSVVLRLSSARERVMEKLVSVFPGCKSAPAAASPPSPPRAPSERREVRDCAVQRHPIMSDKARAQFLRGRGVSQWAPESHRIRFTRGVFLEPEGAPGGWELPLLYPLCDSLDAALDLLQGIRFRGRLPMCLRGHMLQLVDSDTVVCSQHREQKAVWSCATCQCNYGMCCRSHQPKDFDGSLFKRVVCKESRTCDRCDLALIGPDRIAYESESTTAVVCRYCAAEPFPRISTRWLASYNTCLCLMGLWLAYLFFMLVIESV
jgi:hypothetical protein